MLHPSGKNTESYFASGESDAQFVLDIMHDRSLFPRGVPALTLDFGCGDGRMAFPLASRLPRHKKLAGLDASELNVKRAIAAAQTLDDPKVLSFVHGTSPALAVNEIGKKFNLIYSLSVFIHYGQEAGRILLKEVGDALVGNGVAAIQIPLYALPVDPGSYMGVCAWTLSQFLSCAAEAGLEVARTFVNDGPLDPLNPGPNHARYQILVKPE
jgi:SAM-dependent methyltransferase